MVRYNRISSIRPAGSCAVYDLEIREHHSFIAGGIVVHNCSYCYSSEAGQWNEGAGIDHDTIRAFLDDAAEIGVKGVSFVSDGESSHHPDFAWAINHGKSVGLAMAVGSNALTITRRISELILPHLTYLRVNISAGEKKRYAEIMGVKEAWFDRVCQNIRDMMRVKMETNSPCTVGMQMVLMPEFRDQILPFARLAVDLGVDYGIIKHCSDDEFGHIGVDYDGYDPLYPLLREAEAMSTHDTAIKVKWSKIGDRGKRDYARCFGPPFLLQISGTGLIAPCLAGSTRMLTMNGLERIDALTVGEHRLLTPRGYARATAWRSGRKPMVSVTLSNGLMITTTPDHKLRVGDKWMASADLAGAALEPMAGNASWLGTMPFADTLDYVRLGFVLGDGFAHTARNDRYVCIGAKDGDVEPLFNDCPHSSRARPDRRYIRTKSRLAANLDTLGVDLTAKLPWRTMPEEAFGLSPTAMRLLLRGLFSANGHAEKGINQRIGLKTTSLGLARDVQLMLMALGIRSRIVTNAPASIEWPNGTYVSRASYMLSIAGWESTVLFRETIGFVQQYKQAIADSYSTTRKAPVSRACTVVAIFPTDEGDVFDFSVDDESHCAWANGFVAHNCGMLFNDRYKEKYHVGNIAETRFKDIWQSERYWEVMKRLNGPEFDARSMCGSLCLQHKTNQALRDHVEGKASLYAPKPFGVAPPAHIEFI